MYKFDDNILKGVEYLIYSHKILANELRQCYLSLWQDYSGGELSLACLIGIA